MGIGSGVCRGVAPLMREHLAKGAGVAAVSATGPYASLIGCPAWLPVCARAAICAQYREKAVYVHTTRVWVARQWRATGAASRLARVVGPAKWHEFTPCGPPGDSAPPGRRVPWHRL